MGGASCSRADAGAGSNYTFLNSYERDSETSLDFAQARYYASTQGRFTSVDPLTASAIIGNPQTFNRYSYVTNSPLTLIDPSGMFGISPGGSSQGSAGMPLGNYKDERWTTPPPQSPALTQEPPKSLQGVTGGASGQKEGPSPCSSTKSNNSNAVLIIARSIGGNEGELPSREGHAALVFNFGANGQNDHYLAQAGPSGAGPEQTLSGSVNRVGSAGWYDSFRHSEGGNWTNGGTREVPVELKATFYLSASQNNSRRINAINDSLNSMKQKYNYQNGPNSNSYVHQFMNKLCGQGFAPSLTGSMPLRGW